MLSERILSKVVRALNTRYLDMSPVSPDDTALPGPKYMANGEQQRYMLYAHVPFCEKLCPYCSFNRFPFEEETAHAYFDALRKEMRMVSDLGYDFESMYVGGGTPTIMIDELCETIDLARELFSITDVSCETNPNHLIKPIVDKLNGRVQRLSVGVQSFDDGLLRQMQRFEKYGSGYEILERLQNVVASGVFDTLNADMIFNFPAQDEDMLIRDLAFILESGVNQVTFYPLMASPSVERSLAETVGRVDYSREERFYRVISEGLTGGAHPAYKFGSAWTFNRCDNDFLNCGSVGLIDEYVVDYEEYPAIGSGGMSYLDGGLYVNTFSVREYIERINSGRLSVMGKSRFNKTDRMRYRYMMQLFGLRLDKYEWRRDFGCDVANGVPAEYLFLRSVGAFAKDTPDEITLSAKGRYLLVALMRQFFIGVNGVRDKARAALPPDERKLFECAVV
jgi:coproporphyrinogen III oxidase-like Fe-S oxidoreductase